MRKEAKIVETVPSYRSGHLPAEEDVKRLRTLTAPHVESFNYFLDIGLPEGIKDVEPAEFDLVDPKILRENPGAVDWSETTTVRFWVEDVKIAKPLKSASSGGRSNKLLPRECRERGLMYSGPITATFCYVVIQRRNGNEIPGRPLKMQKHFGNMPIMVLSKACHLEGSTPTELVKAREEVSYPLDMMHSQSAPRSDGTRFSHVSYL